MAAPDHRFVQNEPSVQMLRDETWLLGPSAAEESGVVPSVIRRLGVPEERQQIFQSHAAALEEAKRGRGLSLTLSFAVAPDLAAKSLVRIAGPHLRAQGAWSISTLPGQQATPSAEEMTPVRHHPTGDPVDAARPRRSRTAGSTRLSTSLSGQLTLRRSPRWPEVT